jgi:3-phenylpropionate/trans-cinnamate dioxygenase ferredoxin reductase subunit
MTERIVILGASLAGATAAATLRQEGFDGEVVMIGAEAEPPYERPALSKEYLRGEQKLDDFLVRAREFYPENEIVTRSGVRANRVHPAEGAVELAGGERIGYGKLLIATGARNRRFPIPGLDLEGIHDLRVLGDADRIRARVNAGSHAVVVGMGFIGSEVTASFRQLGVEVTAIEAAPVPLYRVLGGEVGRVLEGIHRDHGVRMIFDDHVEAFEGDGRVERVLTRNGRRIDCDFVVVGLGVEPETELVSGTEIKVDNGIVVDELSRTSVAGVFAAGDVANHAHPIFGRRIRVEHWQNALKQGAAAARSMLGRGRPYDEVHWFWSDQYDTNIQYAGFHTSWDALVVRGSMADRSFVAFYINDGRVDAAVAINRGKDLRRAIPLIKTRVPVDPRSLRDEAVDLRKLPATAQGPASLRPLDAVPGWELRAHSPVGSHAFPGEKA